MNDGKQNLEKVTDEIAKLSQKLKDLEGERKRLISERVQNEAKALFEAVKGFAEMFRVGIVREEFNKISDILERLEGFDENYISKLGAGDPYEAVEGDVQVQYLVSYLLGGLWRKDTDLWPVLAKIEDTRSLPGNLFIKEG